MKIVLVRHGQTDCNRDGIWMGIRLDVSINETGKAQMNSIVPELKSLNPELIICSPMRRTRESAEIIKEALEIPIEFDERIMEVDVGSLSGQSRVEAATAMGLSLEEATHQYRVGQHDYSPFGGETAQDILGRTEDFLNDLSQRKERCIIIMSHGGLVRSLHMVITGSNSLVNEGIKNASIIVVEHG